MLDIDHFLNKFLKPPAGATPEAIKEKLRYWIDVANSPEKYTDDRTPYALGALRRNARQNARRIALRNPRVAEQLASEAA